MLQKCCPPGQSYSSPSFKQCAPEPRRPHSTEPLPWLLPINGHLYSEQELTSAGVLVYNASTSLKTSNASRAACRDSGREVHDESDTFHVGPDARLHVTDTHNDMPTPTKRFCVELFYEDPGEAEEIFYDDGDYGDYE